MPDKSIKPCMMEFFNGWGICVHQVRDGDVYFQRWAPGIERQSFLDELRRMPVDTFARAVEAARMNGAVVYA